MSGPIFIVPWTEDFIEALARFLVQETGGDFSRVLVVFPHHRPARYLKAALARQEGLAKPFLAPRALSIEDLVTELARGLRPEHRQRAGTLDQVAVLYRAVEKSRQRRPEGLLSSLPLEQERFFPWGVRLGALIEELLRHNLVPSNLAYVRDEVIPWAGALLEQLGDIFEDYLAELDRLKMTTSGLDHGLVAGAPDRVATLLGGSRVVAAGFYALGGAEEAMFRSLWSAGSLEVFWHTDPALAKDGPDTPPHPCVAEQEKWLGRWKARAVLAPGARLEGREPAVRFHEGFDLHSQLLALAKELARFGPVRDAAVVLPGPDLLMPLLHHLPDQDLNISMGYPLNRSALFEFVETLLGLQETRSPDGPLHWREVVAFLRHPYLRMLAQARSPALRLALHQWEEQVRSQGRYVAPRDFLPLYEEILPEEEARVEEFRREILARCLDAFAQARTLEDLSQALAGVVELLGTWGQALWKRHLKDAECLYRLSTRIVPELSGSGVSRVAYPRSVLFSVLRELVALERVSFEPEPLTGLQVLGMLETRLLRFDRVIHRRTASIAIVAPSRNK